MNKASIRQNNEQTLNVESLSYPEKSYLTQKALESSSIESTSDSVNNKFASESKAQNGKVIVPDTTKRIRSASVPRTIRTLKVTATVTPSPVLNRKTVKSNVKNSQREFMPPIPFQSKLSEANIAKENLNPILNGNINKPEVEGANLFTTPDNGVQNHLAKNVVFLKKDMEENDGQGKFRRNFMLPVTLSEGRTSCKPKWPALNENVHAAEVKGMTTLSKGIKEEKDSNNLFTSTNVKECDRPEN